MKYFGELKSSMNFLSKKKNSIFIGQAVEVPGTAIFNTLKEINIKKRIELPVTEEMQMGITIGLMMEGFMPISVFPRWNFLLLAINQLVNHLDKIHIMNGKKAYKSRAIIRTSIGSQRPMHPQYQHIGDYTDPIKKMCKNINVVRLDSPKNIFREYKNAAERVDGKSTILVEYGDYYNEK